MMSFMKGTNTRNEIPNSKLQNPITEKEFNHKNTKKKFSPLRHKDTKKIPNSK